MSIENSKNQIKKDLLALKEEAYKLLSNIDNALERLEKVSTEEDVINFDREIDIEDGLEIINLF